MSLDSVYAEDPSFGFFEKVRLGLIHISRATIYLIKALVYSMFNSFVVRSVRLEKSDNILRYKDIKDLSVYHQCYEIVSHSEARIWEAKMFMPEEEFREYKDREQEICNVFLRKVLAFDRSFKIVEFIVSEKRITPCMYVNMSLVPRDLNYIDDAKNYRWFT